MRNPWNTLRFIGAVTAVAACGTPDPAPTQGVETALDPTAASVLALKELSYALPTGRDTTMAKLDLYRLDDGHPRPLVLLVHGGSWMGGDKSNFAEAAPAFIPWWLERGYTVAAVNFRLATRPGSSSEVGPKDQVSDIAHALAWLLADAEAHSIDPQGEVVAVGYSSGAHLVALLGADGRYLEAADLAETRLQATVSLDVHAYDVPFALSLMPGSVVEANIPLIEHLFGESEQEQLAASPIHYLDGYVAPAMLVSVQPSPSERGTHGYIVAEAAKRYSSALRSRGHTVKTFHDSNETHGSLAIGFGEDGDAVTAAVAAFLDALRRSPDELP